LDIEKPTKILYSWLYYPDILPMKSSYNDSDAYGYYLNIISFINNGNIDFTKKDIVDCIKISFDSVISIINIKKSKSNVYENFVVTSLNNVIIVSWDFFEAQRSFEIAFIYHGKKFIEGSCNGKVLGVNKIRALI